MRVYLQVLSLRSGFSDPALLLFFDQRRLLFNACEGLQRLDSQWGLGASQITDVFLTSLSPMAAGGLLGLLLSNQQNAKQSIRLFGPSGLSSYCHWLKLFLRPTAMKVSEVNHSVEIVKEDFVTVETVLGSDNRVSYIVAGPESKGNIIKKKAEELGIKGRMFQEIIANGEINLSGRVVKLQEISTPAQPRFLVAVSDVSESSPLSDTEELIKSLSRYPNSYDLSAVVHFAPKGVVSDSAYQRLWESAGTRVDHIITANDKERVESALPWAEGLKRHQHSLVPALFPLSKGQKESGEDWEWKSEKHAAVFSKFFLKYFLSPWRLRGPVHENSRPTHQYSPSAMKPQLTLPKSTEYSSLVNTAVPGADPVIAFFGTASSSPSLSRNVPCIYLGEWGGGLLLDCGEGSYGQMAAHFGAERTAEVLKNLRGVVVSHMHPDHHCGIARVLEARRGLAPDPLLLIGPPALALMLRATGLEKYARFIEAKSGEVEVEGLKKVTLVPVDHVPSSFGVVIEHQAGWKLVYSGDTRPCKPLIAAGANATILIHEATFDDSQSALAKERKHCTVSEALTVSEEMKAWRSLLTHFTKRSRTYPALPWAQTLLAFDHMEIRFSQCEHSHAIAPLLVPHTRAEED